MKLLFRFYNYYFSADKELVKKLRPVIGFIPLRTSTFKLAFSHKSGSNDKEYAIQNNERLEYLGDAILGTIVAEYLFKKYPNANEAF